MGSESESQWHTRTVSPHALTQQAVAHPLRQWKGAAVAHWAHWECRYGIHVEKPVVEGVDTSRPYRISEIQKDWISRKVCIVAWHVVCCVVCCLTQRTGSCARSYDHMSHSCRYSLFCLLPLTVQHRMRGEWQPVSTNHECCTLVHRCG